VELDPSLRRLSSNVVDGLVPVDSGRVGIDGNPICGPGPGGAMVFQQPALLPWLHGSTERGLRAWDLRLKRGPAFVEIVDYCWRLIEPGLTMTSKGRP